MRPSRFIALLRGINVGGRNMVPMAELRTLALDLEWVDVQTWIQSGNLIFHAAAEPSSLAADLELAIERRFGLAIPVIIRAAADWTRYPATNPFAAASSRAPNLVMLALSKDHPKDSAVSELRASAANGELISQVDDAIWIHYAGGMARSRLSPGLLDRAVGSPVTTRNSRTVTKLAELAVR